MQIYMRHPSGHNCKQCTAVFGDCLQLHLCQIRMRFLRTDFGVVPRMYLGCTTPVQLCTKCKCDCALNINAFDWIEGISADDLTYFSALK